MPQSLITLKEMGFVKRSIGAMITGALFSVGGLHAQAGPLVSSNPETARSSSKLEGTLSGSTGSAGGASSEPSDRAVALEAAKAHYLSICTDELAGVRPSAGERIICRAMTQQGLCESDRGEAIFPRGQVDYTFGSPEAWCSEFVSFNYLVAGIPFRGGSNDELPWLLRNVEELRTYFQSRNAYIVSRGSLARPTRSPPQREFPKPGDWLELRDGSHSGVALGVFGAGILVSIEGNVGGCVAFKTRTDFLDPSKSDLVGWGSVSEIQKSTRMELKFPLKQ